MVMGFGEITELDTEDCWRILSATELGRIAASKHKNMIARSDELARALRQQAASTQAHNHVPWF